MKRGVIEMQFNWIFILLIGALILVFFFAIVNQQQKTSNIKIAFQVREKLDSILAGAAAGPIERTESIEIPKLEITADCDNFYLSGQQVALPITLRPIFSADIVRGDFLLLWSQDWSVPFAISNFLYITSPEIRYVFVDTNPLARRLYNEFPDSISKDIIPPQNISNLRERNNYKIKFIFFNEDPTKYAANTNIKTDSEDITAVNLQGTIISGNVDFYKGRPFAKIGSSTKYLGTASMYGAIFSENPDNYNCLMNKAFQKLGLVADVYLNRSDRIIQNLQDEDCKIFHAAAQSKLNALAAAPEYTIDTYPDVSFNDQITQLITINRQAIDSSCPAIY